MKKIYVFLFFFLEIGFLNFLLEASNSTDSLFSHLKTVKTDTEKASILNVISSELRYKNPDSSILLGKQALLLAQKSKWLEGMGNIYSNLGIFYRLKSDYNTAYIYQIKSLEIFEKLSDDAGIAMATGNLGVIYAEQGKNTKALKCFLKALKIDSKKEDKVKIARWLSNVGTIYMTQGNFPKALDYFFRSLKISEELNNKNGIAVCLSNIGNIYNMQENLNTALDYYAKSLKLAEEMGHKYGIALLLDNIGNIYISQGKYNQALEFFFKSLKIGELTGDKYNISTTLGNIGLVYKNQGDSALNSGNEIYALTVKYPLALEYLNKGLVMVEEIGNKAGIAHKTGNLASVYFMQKDLEKAIEYCLKSLNIAKEIGNKELCKDNFLRLAEIYKNKGENNLNNLNGGKFYKQAYHYYIQHILYRDSIYNKDNEKKQTRLETQYEFEKAEIIKKNKEADALRKKMEEKSRRNILQYSGISMVLFVLLTLIILLVRIKVGRKTVEAIIFISILIGFEFILVLIDPYVELWTGGAPALKLIVNATVAVFIYPIHNWIERIVLKRILRRR